MKKKFGKLSKPEQSTVELEYHQMAPEEFDEQMDLLNKMADEALTEIQGGGTELLDLDRDFPKDEEV